MNTHPFLTGLAALLATGTLAPAQPTATTPAGALRVSSARIVQAPGGSYITGSLQPAFGYAAPSAPHVHITVYGRDGKVLAEKVDRVTRQRLIRANREAPPHASYVAFVPFGPASISRVSVVEHSGHTHPGS